MQMKENKEQIEILDQKMVEILDKERMARVRLEEDLSEVETYLRIKWPEKVAVKVLHYQWCF